MSRFAVSGRRAADICDAVEQAIRDGVVGPGDQLPTVRSLADELGVSPTTVAAAYRQLRQRGVISTHGRGGTRVHLRPPLDVPVSEPLPPDVRDLRVAAPDPQVLPDRRGVLAGLDATAVGPGDDDLPYLVDLLTKDLLTDDVRAEHLAMAGSANAALAQVLAATLRPGDRVAVEDPADPVVRDLLTAEGYQLMPLAMDQRGVRPDRLDAVTRGPAHAVILTPRAQDPTSTAFDEARRAELTAVVDDHPELLIIERDPVGPVAGVNYRTILTGERDRWAVLRSFGMGLGSDLDVTTIAGDASTVARVRGRQVLAGGRVPMLIQRLVLELLSSDEVLRTMSLAARTYGARRVTFLAELRNRGIIAQGLSGPYVWLPVDREHHVTDPLLQRGWAVTAGERFRIDAEPGLRIATSRLTTDEARRLADDLLEVLAA
ncbi:MAG: aminotransferase class I/II-fold pyridoxal phosphate-dependent enzyme [Actinomycetota bacterium]